MLHLSPRFPEVFAAIRALRLAGVGGNVPFVLVIDDEAAPAEDRFLAAGLASLAAAERLPLAGIREAIAAAAGTGGPAQPG